MMASLETLPFAEHYLVLKQASAILRDAEKFHAQQKAFVNERLEPWTKS